MDAYAQYRTQAVTTASPAQLVAMLYQGALTAITVAEQALAADDGDRELAHRELVRAQAIVDRAVHLARPRAGRRDRTEPRVAVRVLLRASAARQRVQGRTPCCPGVRQTLAGLADAWNEMIQQQADRTRSHSAGA